MFDFSTKKKGQLSRLLFLKIHDKLDIFKEDFEVLQEMITKTAETIDEFQAIEYRLEEINEALGNPFALYIDNNKDDSNNWLHSMNEPETLPSTNHKKRKYDQGDIRNWLENENNPPFLKSDLFDENVYSKLNSDSDLERAIELSKNDIHFEDDVELQLALELSKNQNNFDLDSWYLENDNMKIKTIDN